MISGKYMMHRKIMREIVKASEKYAVPDEIPIEREKLIEIAAQCFATLAAMQFRAAIEDILSIVEEKLNAEKDIGGE